MVECLPEIWVGGLQAKSRKPHRYYKAPQSTVNLIIELRRSKRWGPNKIEGYLCNYRPKGIVPVSYRTIHRILVEAGLNNPIPAPRKTWGKHRFERLYSNSLWQAVKFWWWVSFDEGVQI